MSIKSSKPGKALQHSDYISRTGRYGRRPDADHLVAQEFGNLPTWAAGSTRSFWKAADAYERANGAVYREIEAALPSELSLEEQKRLVQELVKQHVGSKPYQWAIHKPTAALGNVPQPHLHLMISDRVPDEVERCAETYFRRFNRNFPEKGGCRKDSGGRDRHTLRQDTIALRQTWADLINRHLEQHGHQARVDHRSNVERGIATAAGRHLGPARTRQILASTYSS